MTLHLKSREYPFRPRLLFSCFIAVGVGFPQLCTISGEDILSIGSSCLPLWYGCKTLAMKSDEGCVAHSSVLIAPLPKGSLGLREVAV